MKTQMIYTTPGLMLRSINPEIVLCGSADTSTETFEEIENIEW